MAGNGETREKAGRWRDGWSPLAVIGKLLALTSGIVGYFVRRLERSSERSTRVREDEGA